ncbi:MAG: hypothetical protein JSV52_07520 [Candidatus Zixiibacteriota bacterium]|nr:MAG: hypothetical protein JSV52_07520 [candidate division Zixibacteria bacterium]
MLKLFKNYVVLGLAAIILLAGCGIVSMTFVIEEDFSLVGSGDFYSLAVDVTQNEDWQDHEEDIEFVELVAFDMYLTNNEPTSVTFNGYVDDYDAVNICTDRTCFDGLTTPTRVLKDIIIPANSTRHITPGESLAYIENLDVMKAFAREGQFNFYGISTGGAAVNFSVDEGTVIVILMVSGM